MNYDTGERLLMNGVRGFHGRFKKMYGQIALRLDDKTYLMTGGNKLLAGIVEDDILVCDINTGYLGKIFSICPEINALIFGCSQDAVKVSNEYDVVPIALEDIAQITGAELPVISEAIPGKVEKALRNSSVCLVRGTGLIAAASNMRKTVAAAQIAQKMCEAVVHGKMIGGVKPFSAIEAVKIKNSFMNRYVELNQSESVDFIGFDEESFAKRAELIECGKDLVKNDLVYGSWGNLSLRYNDEEMLISPSSIDYFDIKIEDVVRVKIDTLEYGKQRVPSGDALLHATMYKNLPDCNAIIHTHSNAISVFAACEAGFAINDPTMRQLIGDVKVIKYAGDGDASFAVALVEAMRDTHAIIVAHHGAFFYGPSMEHAYKIAEAVEMVARSLLEYDKKELDSDEAQG